MRYLALNGFRFSLDRYFGPEVECINRFNWTEKNAREYALTITTPTTIIGFSDGATAALAMSDASPFVHKVYAHSPMFHPRETIRHQDISLFRTKGDRTPTYAQTRQVYDRYAESPAQVQLLDLPALPNAPVCDLATFIMKIKKHQFHNCLPYLPQSLLK